MLLNHFYLSLTIFDLVYGLSAIKMTKLVLIIAFLVILAVHLSEEICCFRNPDTASNNDQSDSLCGNIRGRRRHDHKTVKVKPTKANTEKNHNNTDHDAADKLIPSKPSPGTVESPDAYYRRVIVFNPVQLDSDQEISFRSEASVGYYPKVDSSTSKQSKSNKPSHRSKQRESDLGVSSSVDSSAPQQSKDSKSSHRSGQIEFSGEYYRGLDFDKVSSPRQSESSIKNYSPSQSFSPRNSVSSTGYSTDHSVAKSDSSCEHSSVASSGYPPEHSVFSAGHSTRVSGPSYESDSSRGSVSHERRYS